MNDVMVELGSDSMPVDRVVSRLDNADDDVVQLRSLLLHGVLFREKGNDR